MRATALQSPSRPIRASDSQSDLRARIEALGPWFHNMVLDGIETAPDHFLGDYPNFKWKNFASAVPRDLRGKTVLDIGCNAGFYALEMKRRGASRVVGIDSDARYLAQAALAADITGLAIELRCLSVYDVAVLRERFDLVIFMGVLYHLRHPLLALDLIREHVAGGLLLFQSLQRGDPSASVDPDYPFEERALFTRPGAPRLQFVEHRFAGDPTNWWVPNQAAVEAMLRASGFAISAHPEPEVYLCRSVDRPTLYEPTLDVRTRPRAEPSG
jgi:tRNA (mo5U34)-methyltransferase